MKSKVCKICKKTIKPEHIMIQAGGYVRSYCKPCNKIVAKKYNIKIKKLKENTFWETE